MLKLLPLFSGENLWLPLNTRLDRTQNRSGGFRGKNILLQLPGKETMFLDRPSRNLVTIRSTLYHYTPF